MITREQGCPSYTVKEGSPGLPIGEIIEDRQGWVFWPSVYRKPVTMRIAAEILHVLEELNAKPS